MQRENYLLYICSGNCGQKKLPLGGVNGTGGVGYGARGTGIAVPAALSEDAARGDLADSGGYQASETGCFALHETLIAMLMAVACIRAVHGLAHLSLFLPSSLSLSLSL